MLNALYYLPINIFGYFIWKRNMNGSEVKAKMMTNKARVAMVVCSGLCIAIYGTILNSIGGSTPYLDSTSTILSIVAQLLMLSMFAEQWILWQIINSVSILMWLPVSLSGDAMGTSMVIMWSAYLINSIYGYKQWKGKVKSA